MEGRRSGTAAIAAFGRRSFDWRRAGQLGRALAGRFSEHGLFVYTSAIAFRALVALVPLTLLALGLLGALGKQEIWGDTIAPAVRDRVTAPVYVAVDSSVEKIFSSSSAGLIAFASVLLFWNLLAASTVIMTALSRIHDVEERRPFRRRLMIGSALALVVGVCVIGAMLVVALVGRIDAGGALSPGLAVVKWATAVALLGLAVGMLVRFAPAERPEVRWASAGSLTIVAGWIVASLVFRWWVTTVADFKSAIGQLTFFLLLTAYVFVTSAVFLLGVELDELVRKDSE